MQGSRKMTYDNMGIYNVAIYSIGSLLLGLLITTIGTCLMFLILKSWYNNRVFTPLSLIFGAIVFLFLAYHAIIICGAITIKGYGDKMETLINSYVEGLPENTVLTKEDSDEIIKKLNDDIPLVGYYADAADFHGHSPADIAMSMNNAMQNYMNGYIVRHILWSIFFIILGAFIVIKTMNRDAFARKRSSHHSRIKYYDE